MKILSLFSGLALVTFGVLTNAPAQLLNSNPADDTMLTTSPPNLLLNF